jgi:hypothetical protein
MNVLLPLPLLWAFALAPLEAPAPEVRHGASLGVQALSTWGATGTSPTFLTLELATWHSVSSAHTPAALLLGGGLRVAFPSARAPDAVPLEGFVRAQLASPAWGGVWEPAMGVELGLSGLSRLQRQFYLDPRFPTPLRELEQARVSPLYAAFVASPLRLRLPWLRLSVLELLWGTPLGQPGAAARLQLGLLSVGKDLP